MLARLFFAAALVAVSCGNPKDTRTVSVSEPYGTITSPGYPNGYNDRSGESWRLRVPDAESYTLYFDVVDLDSSGCYDYLVLYDDEDYTASGEVICDKPTTPKVLSTGKMTITFNVASNWVAGQRGVGFSIRYQASGPGIEGPPTDSPDVGNPNDTTTTTTTQQPTANVVTTEGPSFSTNKPTETLPPSGNFPPGNQDDSNCGVPAFAPVITGLDYVAQGQQLSRSVTRVVNGETAVPHSWPWQVSIQGSAGSAYCGGTLVQPQWIVTAAHCAELVFLGTYGSDQVLLGAHDKRETESTQQLIDIIAKYSHPQYDSPARSHDVSLLKLKQPAELNDYVSLACEAHTGWSFPAGMQCVVTGWGVTKEGGNIGTNILQQAPLPLMSDEDCYTLYQEANLDTTSDMQCAGGQGKGACNGDSGGPLNCYVNDRWYHMGIVSFGEANCDTDIASIFAKVAELREFIDSTIALHS